MADLTRFALALALAGCLIARQRDVNPLEAPARIVVEEIAAEHAHGML